MNIGRYGEDRACEYLERKPCIIIKRNFYTRIGEIDIITKEGNNLVFIEVKTRIGLSAGYPYEAITAKKLMTIRRVARIFLQEQKQSFAALRVDVISIVLSHELKVLELQHFENVDL